MTDHPPQKKDEAVRIEALAHGRDELLEELGFSRDVDPELARRVAEERALANELTLAFRESAPALPDLDVMISRAMELSTPAPSRRALVGSFVVGSLATVAFALLALGGIPAPEALLRRSLAFVSALDRVAGLLGGWPVLSLASAAVAFVVCFATARNVRRFTSALVAGAALSLSASGATAQCPSEPKINIVVQGQPATQVLRLAAEAAGVGFIGAIPGDPTIDLSVTDAALEEVVAEIVSHADVQARCVGDVLVVGARPADVAVAPVAPVAPEPPVAPAAPAAPQPPAAPVIPAALLGDVEAPVTTFGGDSTIAEGRVVEAVFTMGGDAEIIGTVTTEVITMGGDIVVRGVVLGDVVSMGGDVEVVEGAVVRGELITMGGTVTSADGRVGSDGGLNVDLSGDGEESFLESFFAKFFESATNHGFLFLFGLLLLGAARERFLTIQRVIAKRPGRLFIIGVMSFVAAVVLTIGLAITIIGIPGAVAVFILSGVAMYAGIAALGAVVGHLAPLAFLRDKPVAQLGFGVFVMFVLSLVPGVEVLAAILISCIGLGACVLTRFGEVRA